MLDVGRFRVLLAISEHGGSSGAARALGRPAAELTGQVSDWEREIGVPLVDGDRLTPAGRRLAEYAGRLLGQLEAAESDAAAVAGRASGTLRLGVGADAGRVLLVDTLLALRAGAPDLRLHVRQLPDEQIGALGSTLDVVVVGEYGGAVPHRPDASVERRELFTEPLLLAVPARHPATGASVRLAELAGEAWIGGAGDALVALERAAAGAGFAPRLVADVGEDALALTLVAAGHGVALVPASAAPQPVDAVRFLTVLDGGLRRTVVAAVRRSAAADPGVRRLLDALAASARRVAAAVPGVSAAAATGPAGAPAPPGGGGRRPDPLFDPLPPSSDPSSVPPRNGRRDPWADRARPDSNGIDPRNGSPSGTELPQRNGTPSFGTPSGTELPSRNGSADFPAPGSVPGPDLPGRNGGAPSYGSLPSADLPAPGGFPPPGGDPGGFPPPGGDLPGRGNYGSPPAADPPGDPSGRSGAVPSYGSLPSADLPTPGIFPPPGGDLPDPGDAPSWGGDVQGYGSRADLPPGDLPGRGAGDLPGRGAGGPGYGPPPGDLPGRNAGAPGYGPPAGDLPGRNAGPSGYGGPAPTDVPGSDLPTRGGTPGYGSLPAPGREPGLPAPGAEPPSRGGASPYRTPPPTSDLPPGEMPRFGNDPASGAGRESAGPNPYRPDNSGHPSPDPFRAGGPDLGPNPYRSTGNGQPAGGRGERPDSLAGVELFSAGNRSGALPPPGAPDRPARSRNGGDGGQLPASPDLGVRSLASSGTPRGSRAAARGGDGAEGTLPPAPAGAAEDVRLSIFEDLQSEWFVQQDDSSTRTPSWQMAADDGWRAAARLAEPTTAGTTTAGLPRRRPQAMAVPGAVGGSAEPTNTTHRSPQEVRGRLSSYRDGVRRGRHAERPQNED